MSRKKDIAVLLPLKAKLFDLTEKEARCQLEKLSARELRARRAKIESVQNPMQDPHFRELIKDWEKLNETTKKMLVKVRARNLPPHPTVQ